MTVLIGLEHDGVVYMGADSISTDGYDRSVTLVPKIFHHPDGYLIGYAGSFRMGQILRYHLSCPGPIGLADSFAWMVQRLTESVRSCLKDFGFLGEGSADTNWRIMVGLKGQLFTIEPDFQVARYACRFDTAGSGEQFARGAMLALSDQTPFERVRRSLEIATELSVMVTPPYLIRSTADTADT